MINIWMGDFYQHTLEKDVILTSSHLNAILDPFLLNYP
jgi:hypothetical protein